MTDRGGEQDELDRALERALAVAAAWVKRPRSERVLARVLDAVDALATRGWSVPPRALPAQVLAAAADPDDWFARFYDPMRIGVLEVHLRAELQEWQPLVDQLLAAFRRDEHPLVLVSGLAVLDSVIARADMRRDPGANSALHVDDESWGNAHRFALSSSLETAATRLRPVGGGRHWTVEGRDSPFCWSREDALKVLNALGTAAALLPQRLTRTVTPPPQALPAAKRTTSLPALVTVADDDVGNVFAAAPPLAPAVDATAGVDAADPAALELAREAAQRWDDADVGAHDTEPPAPELPPPPPLLLQPPAPSLGELEPPAPPPLEAVRPPLAPEPSAEAPRAVTFAPGDPAL